MMDVPARILAIALMLPLSGAVAAPRSPAAFATSSVIPLHGITVSFGDSITANRGFPGFSDWANFYNGGRFARRPIGSNSLGPTGWNQGVVGNTTTQLLARISNVIAEKPRVVTVLAGINDIVANGATAATVQTNLRSIYDQLIAAGIKVVAITILPCISPGYSTGQETVRVAVNSWIMSQTDVKVVVSDNYITSPATQLQSDGKHPNGPGGQALGLPVAQAEMALSTPSSVLYTEAAGSPSTNLLVNPFFTGGTTTATGWTFFSAANGLTRTLSKSTLNGATAQKIVWSGTATANVADNLNQNITPPGGNAGDQYECWAQFQVNRYTGMAGISVASGNNTGSYSAMSTSSQDSTALTVPFTGVLRSPPSPLATTGGTLSPRFSFIPANGSVIDAEVLVSQANCSKVYQ